MAVEVTIPSLGESISEVVLTKWHKSTGDYVQKDEPLYEIESDKITTDVPSVDSGVITVEAKEGSELKIGTVVAHIDTAAAQTARGGSGRNAASASSQSSSTAAASSSGDQRAGGEPDGVRATSVARKIAEEKGVDLGSIQGTGPSGRITKDDVLRMQHPSQTQRPRVEAKREEPARRETPQPAAPTSATSSRSDSDSRATRREKMSKLRERIAERLVFAKNTTAMLTTFNECDMSGVMAMRTHYKEAFEKRHGVGLGYMSFFVKAACAALAKYPRVNAFIDGDSIEYHDYVDLSVAVSTEKGLTVPILRDVHRMSFAQIEQGVKELAAKARDGKLTMDDLTGGTFTITNGGVFGSLNSTPILNPPQSGILGMHAIKNRPIENPDKAGEIVLRPMMYLALSYDHRIVDGAEAVGFLVHVKECIEKPERMLIEA